MAKKILRNTEKRKKQEVSIKSITKDIDCKT